MARLSRAEVFAADEIALVHVMNRTVRRCFLPGDDPVTGKNYDHRKQWIDDQLSLQAKHFEIDLICQAIPSNHFHLSLPSRPRQWRWANRCSAGFFPASSLLLNTSRLLLRWIWLSGVQAHRPCTLGPFFAQKSRQTIRFHLADPQALPTEKRKGGASC